MSQFVFGPGLGYTELSPEHAAAASVAIVGVRRGGAVDLAIDGSESLLNVHVAYLQAAPAAADDPRAVLDAAPIKGELTAPQLAAGGAQTVQVLGPIAPGTTYYVQTVLEIPDPITPATTPAAPPSVQ